MAVTARCDLLDLQRQTCWRLQITHSRSGGVTITSVLTFSLCPLIHGRQMKSYFFLTTSLRKVLGKKTQKQKVASWHISATDQCFYSLSNFLIKIAVRQWNSKPVFPKQPLFSVIRQKEQQLLQESCSPLFDRISTGACPWTDSSCCVKSTVWTMRLLKTIWYWYHGG